MILVSRIVLALLAALGAVYAGRTFDLVNHFDSSSYAYTVFGIIVFLAFAVGWMVGGIAGKGLARGFKRVERAAQARSAGELTVGAIGLLVGLLVSALLYLPVHALPYIGNWLLLPMVLVLSYLFAFTAAKKHRGILRLVGVHSLGDGDPDLENGSNVSTLVDTSAIIDGRIADIVRTGFLGGELVVPEFVLKELQQVADSADPLKRARGRRGLQVVQDLRTDVQVATPDVDFPQVSDVDAKLLKLAKERNMPILTTDFNLNRLAQIQVVHVQHLHVLDLGQPAVLPGERLDVLLIKEGKESNQGVGYLDDGTMVVVERARERIGETLPVQVTSVLQQPSGKIIFTKIAGEND